MSRYGHLFLIAQFKDQLIQFIGLLGFMPGGRLVEQQDKRIGGHGPGDFKAPLGAVGKIFGKLVDEFCRDPIFSRIR